MKANPKARIQIMHSKRGTQVVEKTWSALGWEWFGSKHPDLPMIFEELKTKGICYYSSDQTDGTFTFKALDKMTFED